MSDHPLRDDKLREAIEHLVTKMMEKDLIKTNDKDGLIDAVKEALTAGNNPNESKEILESVFTNPLNMKKLMSLVICANIERNTNDPSLLNIFDTKKLAKALFEPKNSPQEKEEAKKTVSVFLLAMMPKPKGKKEADLLAEELLKENQNELDAQNQQMLQEHLLNYMDVMKTQEQRAAEARQAEFEYVLAFGDSPDGSPIVVTLQTSNVNSFVDQVVLTPTGNAGFLNEELKDLEDNFATELGRKSIISKTPKLTPFGDD